MQLFFKNFDLRFQRRFDAFVEAAFAERKTMFFSEFGFDYIQILFKPFANNAPRMNADREVRNCIVKLIGILIDQFQDIGIVGKVMRMQIEIHQSWNFLTPARMAISSTFSRGTAGHE
jgi:hypothetical protein